MASSPPFLSPARRFVLLATLAALAACHSDAPTTGTADSPTAPPPAATAPAATTGPAAPAGHPTDTLHLPGSSVVRLLPSTAAAFNQLPADTVAEAYSTDPERFADAGLRVRRRGLDLRLQPTARPLVVLSSVPDAQFTLQNEKAVRYQYLGSLPRAHQCTTWRMPYSWILRGSSAPGRRLTP